MRTGIDVGLGIEREVRRASALPTPAVQIDQHRRIGLPGLPDIHALDRIRAIGEALGLADRRGRNSVVGIAAGQHVPLVEGEDALIIQLVHVLLVVIEPDRGPFGADRWCRRTALGRRIAGGERDSAGRRPADQHAPADFGAPGIGLFHGLLP
jgi:hypothetical protein